MSEQEGSAKVVEGSEAPDFTLLRKVGEPPVSLSDYRGKKPVVLLFFPLAFSGVCTAELCQVVEDRSMWNEVGAEVLGISVDSSYVNNRFAQETGADFPVLSDFNREATDAYGVRNDDFFGMKGVADRSAFVVDRDGVVAYAWKTDDPDVLPPFDEIRRVVAGLD